MRGELRRKCGCGGTCGSCANASTVHRSSIGSRTESGVPPIVHDVLRSPGRPLDTATRVNMESRFGHDFSSVRVHSGPRAAASAEAIGARAYTSGRNIVAGAKGLSPAVLAHELTHVIQSGGGDPTPRTIGAANSAVEREADRASVHAAPVAGAANVIHPYRDSSSFNFGADDTATLVEQEYKKGSPWIRTISLHFDQSIVDSNGENTPKGTLTAEYDKGALPNITASVTGGTPTLGLTDSGTFTVTKIRGVGWNDTSLGSAGEGPGKRYAKKVGGVRTASMHFAVYFNGGQALHTGSLSTGSHSCVHVSLNPMQQINYHSRAGVTKVKVTYDQATLDPICCERIAFLGGRKPNPCHKTKCPKP